MDRVSIDGRKPLHIRSGHTPVNIGLMVGSLFASIPAMLNEHARSHSVDGVFPEWAAYLFYAVLLFGSAMTLSATFSQLPSRLDAHSYRVIANRLVRERVGHYAVAGILICFSLGAFTTNGLAGLSASGWLVGIAVGLVFRAWQTHIDLRKLHEAVEQGITTDGEWAAEPDEKT